MARTVSKILLMPATNPVYLSGNFNAETEHSLLAPDGVIRLPQMTSLLAKATESLSLAKASFRVVL